MWFRIEIRWVGAGARPIGSSPESGATGTVQCRVEGPGKWRSGVVVVALWGCDASETACVPEQIVACASERVEKLFARLPCTKARLGVRPSRPEASGRHLVHSCAACGCVYSRSDIDSEGIVVRKMDRSAQPGFDRGATVSTRSPHNR
jgi:hypothetical protein